MRARWSAVCLNCGFPLPGAPGGARASGVGPPPGGSSSSALPWLLVGGAVLGVLVIGGGLLLSFAVLRSPSSASAPVGVAASAPAVATSPIETPSAVVATGAGGAGGGAGTDGLDAGGAAKLPLDPLTPQQLDELEGNYGCALDDTPTFKCRIANGELEKLEGSQRFKGPVSKLPNGNFNFSGTFFCPFGACTHPVAATFVRQAAGRYVGKFGPNSVPGGGPGGERVVLTKTR